MVFERMTETIGSTTKERFYNTSWQMLEERVSGASTAITQFVWGLGYIDALVLTDRDADANGGTGALGQSPSTGATGLEQRLYAQQDANWNVTSLTASSGSVIERYVYDPYGALTIMDSTWTARAGNASSYSQQNLFQGGRLETASSLYTFRNRDYNTSQGRWTRQDPAGYVDGPNLYQALLGQPIGRVDPFGFSPAYDPFATMGLDSDARRAPGGTRSYRPLSDSLPSGSRTHRPTPIPHNTGPGEEYSPGMDSYTPPAWEAPTVTTLQIVSAVCLFAADGIALVEAAQAARAAQAAQAAQAARATQAGGAAEAASVANGAGRAAGAGAEDAMTSGAAVGRAGAAAEESSGARFIADRNGNVLDTNAVSPGRYRQPNGGRTDILQRPDHGAGYSHTHDPALHTDPHTGETFINGLQHPGRAVSSGDIANIQSGAATRLPPRGR